MERGHTQFSHPIKYFLSILQNTKHAVLKEVYFFFYCSMLADWDNVFSILVCCKRSGNIDGGSKEQTDKKNHLPVVTEKQDSRNQIKTIKTSWFTQHKPLAIQWLPDKDTVPS